jgi:glyoxylase-like metal-dependent hydrolase (beta-lactamase superfamily II)
MGGPVGGAWTDLGDGISVRQSAAYRMNSVLLSHPEHALIVDPGVLPSELDDLARAAAAGRPAALTLVFTHGDWDHVLGRPWWPGADRVGHDRLAGELKERRDSILAAAGEAAAAAGERWEKGFEAFRPTLEVSGLHFTRIGPWRVVFRDAFGHSASMLSLHLPERRLLIAGDMLSDIEIPMLGQPLELYRRTLLELVPLVEGGAIEVVVPGHGSIARGAAEALARIRRDLGYLDQLARGVRAARAAGLSLERTLERLDAMDYLGKGAAYSMTPSHHDNVRRVYEEPPAAAPPPRRRRR